MGSALPTTQLLQQTPSLPSFAALRLGNDGGTEATGARWDHAPLAFETHLEEENMWDLHQSVSTEGQLLRATVGGTKNVVGDAKKKTKKAVEDAIQGAGKAVKKAVTPIENELASKRMKLTMRGIELQIGILNNSIDELKREIVNLGDNWNGRRSS